MNDNDATLARQPVVRLRELLDERGVEWDKGEFPNEARTYWRDIVARPWNEQRLYVTALLTPEQAIEATLGPSDPREHGLIPHFWTGDETLHIDLGKLPERIDVTLPDPRGREVYSAKVHRFEPERGECHNASYRLDESRFHCSECGFGCWVKDVADGHDKLPRYCPNCGRRVTDA